VLEILNGRHGEERRDRIIYRWQPIVAVAFSPLPRREEDAQARRKVATREAVIVWDEGVRVLDRGVRVRIE
jgi:hypothetical protein